MARVKKTKYYSLLKELKEKLPREKEEYDKLVEILKPLSMEKACKWLKYLIRKAS
jgi:hypothetical protein